MTTSEGISASIDIERARTILASQSSVCRDWWGCWQSARMMVRKAEQSLEKQQKKMRKFAEKYQELQNAIYPS